MQVVQLQSDKSSSSGSLVSLAFPLSDSAHFGLHMCVQWQMHTGEGATKIPVVYLEAGFALVKVKRYSDALLVFEEVITA